MLNYFKILVTYWNSNAKNILMVLPNLILLGLRLPFSVVENAFYCKLIKNQEIEKDPIFILGYYRSGTTHLQKLISLHPDIGYLNIYKTYFPDSYILTQKWLKPLTQKLLKLLKVQNPIHRQPFDWDLPGEEDIALIFKPSITSLNWLHAFPSSYQEILDKVMSSHELWASEHMSILKKAHYNLKVNQMVLKSPPNTLRMRKILKLYPNAKFIYIARDYEETKLSNQYLWDVVRGACYEQPNIELRDQCISDLYQYFDKTYQEDKKYIQDSNLYEIDFEDLMNDPQGQMKSCFESLGLSYTNEYALVLEDFIIENHGKYRGIQNKT